MVIRGSSILMEVFVQPTTICDQYVFMLHDFLIKQFVFYFQ